MSLVTEGMRYGTPPMSSTLVSPASPGPARPQGAALGGWGGWGAPQVWTLHHSHRGLGKVLPEAGLQHRRHVLEGRLGEGGLLHRQGRGVQGGELQVQGEANHQLLD